MRVEVSEHEREPKTVDYEERIRRGEERFLGQEGIGERIVCGEPTRRTFGIVGENGGEGNRTTS